MEKKIQDYLHLYLGCECVWQDSRAEITNNGKGKLTEIGKRIAVIESKGELAECMPFEAKPILRPLSDMTEEEEDKFYSFWSGSCSTGNLKLSIEREAQATMFLLSKHFDLFGLIPAGLAIDATKVKEAV
jgi:hypothetical protein